MFTIGAVVLVTVLAWYVGRLNEKDRSTYDGTPPDLRVWLLVLHLRQTLRSSCFYWVPWLSCSASLRTGCIERKHAGVPSQRLAATRDCALCRVAFGGVLMGLEYVPTGWRWTMYYFLVIAICLFSPLISSASAGEQPNRGECRGINPSVFCPAGSHCDLGSGHCVPDRVGKGGRCGGLSGIQCEEGASCV